MMAKVISAIVWTFFIIAILEVCWLIFNELPKLFKELKQS